MMRESTDGSWRKVEAAVRARAPGRLARAAAVRPHQARAARTAPAEAWGRPATRRPVARRAVRPAAAHPAAAHPAAARPAAARPEPARRPPLLAEQAARDQHREDGPT